MDPLAAIPQFVEVIQKAGTLGILVIICVVMALEIVRLRKQATKTFAERDAYRVRYVLYKAECDRAKITVDTSALAPLGDTGVLQ